MGKLQEGLPVSADVGVITGLALYCLLEFGSTGSFGWGRSSYVSVTETKAAILLGIGSGAAAAGWWFLRPLHELAALGRESDTADDVPLGAQGLSGSEPSTRSLPSLLEGDSMAFVIGTICLLAFAVASVLPLLAYMPVAVPFLLLGTATLLVLFVRSRVARLRRLITTGAEVEGRLREVPTDWGDGPSIARYAYSYRGQAKTITNTSWFSSRLALRHGRRVIVLCDPRNPGDAVILGPFPDKKARRA